MHIVTILGLIAITLTFATLIFGANDYSKIAWTLALLGSFDTFALVVVAASDADRMIAMWGYQFTNLSLIYLLLCAVGVFFASVITAIVWLWKRYRSKNKKESEIYTTHRVGEVRSDGSWTAQLRRNGRPFGLVNIGSISSLIGKSKK